jgi:hypothetical protein
MSAQFPIFRQKWYQGYVPTKRGIRKHPRVFRVNGLPLQHYVFHTEALMNWGDGSAESADLALSILCNYYCPRPMGMLEPKYWIEIEERQVIVTRRSEAAFRLYKTFLREVVSRWPKDEAWLYTEQELEAWIAKHERDV